MKKIFILLVCLALIGCVHTQLTQKQLLDNLYDVGSLSDEEYVYLQLELAPMSAELSYSMYLDTLEILLTTDREELEEMFGEELEDIDIVISEKMKKFIELEKADRLDETINIVDLTKEAFDQGFINEEEYKYSIAEGEAELAKDRVLHYEDILSQLSEKFRSGELDEFEESMYAKLYRLTKVEYKKAVLRQEQAQRTYNNVLNTLDVIAEMGQANRH